MDRAAASVRAHDDPRLVIDERVGDWYADNRSPGSTLYVMCASAAAYAAADAIPPYPYLWLDGVLHGRRSQEQLVQLFAGDHPPTFVVRLPVRGVLQSVRRGRRPARRSVIRRPRESTARRSSAFAIRPERFRLPGRRTFPGMRKVRLSSRIMTGGTHGTEHSDDDRRATQIGGDRISESVRQRRCHLGWRQHPRPVRRRRAGLLPEVGPGQRQGRTSASCSATSARR